jgi:hypothetical protein
VLETVDLLLSVPQLAQQPLDTPRDIRIRNFEQPADLLEALLLPADGLVGAPARQDLEPPDARRDAGLGDDLEEPDVSRRLGVGPAS